MIKLIASDMDGTLLNEELIVSLENAAAIRRAQKAGIHFVVATGRTYQTGYPLLQARDIQAPFIALNGAQLYDTKGHVQYTNHFDLDVLRRVIDILEKYSVQIDVITNEGTYTNLSYDQYVQSITHDLSGINPGVDLSPYKDEILTYVKQLSLTHVDSFDFLFAEQTTAQALKIVTLTTDDAVRAQIKSEVENQLPELIVTSATPTNLEFNIRSANKGNAVAHYAHSLGLDSSEVAVIGDSLNDLTMIEWAEYSFAVDNAIPEVKAAANYHTLSHQDHAVAQIIDEILDGKYNK